MLFFKKKMSETVAAMIFVYNINRWAEENDALIKTYTHNVIKDRYSLDDFKKGSDELYYAALVYLMQPIKNLFPHAQAQRIEEKIFETISIIGDKSLFQTYLEAQKDFFYQLDDAIPYKLLRRWIGEDIKLGTIETMLACNTITLGLFSFVDYWKRVYEKYKLIESNEKVEQLIHGV